MITDYSSIGATSLSVSRRMDEGGYEEGGVLPPICQLSDCIAQ